MRKGELMNETIAGQTLLADQARLQGMANQQAIAAQLQGSTVRGMTARELIEQRLQATNEEGRDWAILLQMLPSELLPHQDAALRRLLS
jgi:hypothetical protein